MRGPLTRSSSWLILCVRQPGMRTREHQSPLVRRGLLWGAVILGTIAAAAILLVCYVSQPTKVPSGTLYVENLKAARHYKSSFPAQRQTVHLFQKIGVRSA